MIGVPTLEQVRAWIQVPASAVTDADLAQILAGELAIQGRTCRIPSDPENAGPVNASIDGLDATVTVTDGTPGAHYRLAWGDGQNDDVVLDASGNSTSTHTYSSAGTYTARVSSDAAGELVSYEVTVPGEGSLWAEAEYPAALARAALRRCQREVAARAVPLGAFGTETAEYGPVALPRWDSEISRLEASYRIPVVS